MKLLISGATGFIGSGLTTYLREKGHHVVSLVRQVRDLGDDTILWDPDAEVIDDLEILEGFDGVINLSGESIFEGRWNDSRKKRILSSRVQSTKTLVDALCLLKNPPKVMISASAIGFYGDHGDEPCNENTPPGSDFLSDVCKQWEEAAAPAAAKGIRIVNLRFGIVLSKHGGMLGKVLPIFKLGLGGKLGSGKQYMSWITIDDVRSVILFALTESKVNGAYNASTPYPVTNGVFTKMLGRILERPTFFPIPAFVLQMIFGKELANEVFLNSIRVEPLRLTQAGYTFLFPDLEGALRHLLDIYK